MIKIENNWSNIKEFISLTIKLVSMYGFDSRDIVAPLALLPIAFFLSKKGNSSFDISSELNNVLIQVDIRKWLIIVLLKNAFGGSTDTKLKNIRDILLSLASYDRFPINELNQELGIEANFFHNEIEQLLKYNYQGRYTYLILLLIYPDKDWKDMIFHEDHIFPKSHFHLGELRKRGYDEERINRYLSYYDTIVNLQLLTDNENLSKNATPFHEWLPTRDANFKKRHHIPEMESYDLDWFEQFVELRKNNILNVLKNI